jgi:hypothetical protein
VSNMGREKWIVVLLSILLCGCETYWLTVNNQGDSKQYPLYVTDFIADTPAMNAEIPSSAAVGSSFKRGNVTCYEHVRQSDGYTGCCCDGQFSRKTLDRIHRCGH